MVFPTYDVLFRLNAPDNDNNEYRAVLGNKTLTLLDPIPAKVFVVGTAMYMF